MSDADQEDMQPSDDKSADDSASDADSGSGESSDTGTQDGYSDSASQSADDKQSDGEKSRDDSSDEQNMENIGTTNTHYVDTGMITTYEIVMPNPVEGYAAAVVKNAFGEESGAIVVDNTNRYGIPNLVKDLQNFAFLGMRIRSVRYPYWENVAMGWETIFAALFLLECILIALTILLLLWMLIHWYTHRTWTLAGNVQNLQDSIYEKQSRKRYPEYYREKEQDRSEETGPGAEKSGDPGAAGPKTGADEKEKSMLEDKGLKPFEKIPENRKAVQYETKHQDDQRRNGSSAGSDHDGVRQGRQ